MYIQGLNFDADGAPAGAPAPNATPAATGGGDAKFTQADIDRIVGERAKQAERVATERLVKELGYTNPDEVKAVIAAHRQSEDAKKSEAEKAAGLLSTAEKRAQEAEARTADLEARLEEALVHQAISTKASELGFNNPSDAYRLLMDDASVEIEISEDGKLVTGYEKALEALAKSGRLPVRAVTAPPLDGGDGGGKRPGEQSPVDFDEEKLRQQAIALHVDPAGFIAAAKAKLVKPGGK